MVCRDELGLWGSCWPSVSSSQMDQLASVWWHHRCDNYLRLWFPAMLAFSNGGSLELTDVSPW